MTDSMPTLNVVNTETEVVTVPEAKPARKPRTKVTDPDVRALIERVGAHVQAHAQPASTFPLHGGQFPRGSRNHYIEQRARWGAIGNQRAHDGHTGWDDIILETMFDALSADDAYDGLVAVAVVALRAALSLKGDEVA